MAIKDDIVKIRDNVWEVKGSFNKKMVITIKHLIKTKINHIS